MFYRAKRIIEIFCMSTSVLIVHMPAYAGSEISGMVKGQVQGAVKGQLQGAVQNMVSGTMNDSSNDNMLSSVTANAIGAMSTELKGYSSMAPDMVFGSAAGSTQMYSSMASVTEIESSHGKSTDLSSIADMLGSLGSNPIAGMVLGKVTPKAASALGNVNFVSSQIQMMNTASNVVEKKVMNLNSEVVAYRMAAVVADTLVNGGLDNSKKQIKGEKEEFKKCQTELQNIYEKLQDNDMVRTVAEEAYNAIDKMIQAREEIVPSLEGAKKTEMARKVFKNDIESLKTTMSTASEQYKALAATQTAVPNLTEAQISLEKQPIARLPPRKPRMLVAL